MTPTGRSDAIIDRLHSLHPKLIDLSLGRLVELLGKLGNPQGHLPPVIHVAGTNGKGSTCAFLRAIAEAAGQRVHVHTSPHLVRFHERIRLAGRLVDEAMLAATLDEVERVNAGAAVTVFEITTAVTFLLFARVPADLVVLEVGLGGRFDATNVVAHPVATAITSISMDHMDFLGDTLAKIAFEKAGIIKPGAPCATGWQAPEAMAVLRAVAAAHDAPLLARGEAWEMDAAGYEGLALPPTVGLPLPQTIQLPLPRTAQLSLPRLGLPGPHQQDNAGIAIAALRAWSPPWLTDAAIQQGVAQATWPARIQRLQGDLAARVAPHELWLDGGHNPGAGQALARHLPIWADAPLHILVGMKQGKGAAGFIAPLLPFATTLLAVAEPGQHLAMPVAEIIIASGGVARAGGTIAEALDRLPHAPPGRVLICGSLYLAGEVLKADGTLPT